jgi:hypothetical protein
MSAIFKWVLQHALLLAVSLAPLVQAGLDWPA